MTALAASARTTCQVVHSCAETPFNGGVIPRPSSVRKDGAAPSRSSPTNQCHGRRGTLRRQSQKAPSRRSRLESPRAPAEVVNGPKDARKKVAGENRSSNPSADPAGERRPSQRSAGERSKQSGRARRSEYSDQEHQHSRGSDPSTRHRKLPLLGLALVGRNRQDAEEEPGARRGRLLEIEQVGLARGGTRREDFETDSGPSGEPGAQASFRTGRGRVGPDQGARHHHPALRRVAARLQHDVISIGSYGDRVALGVGQQPMSPRPGPRRSRCFEDGDAKLRSGPELVDWSSERNAATRSPLATSSAFAVASSARCSAWRSSVSSCWEAWVTKRSRTTDHWCSMELSRRPPMAMASVRTASAPERATVHRCRHGRERYIAPSRRTATAKAQIGAGRRSHSAPRPRPSRQGLPTSHDDGSERTSVVPQRPDRWSSARSGRRPAVAHHPGGNPRGTRTPSPAGSHRGTGRASGGRSFGSVSRGAVASHFIRGQPARYLLPSRFGRPPAQDVAPGHERTYRVLGSVGRDRGVRGALRPGPTIPISRPSEPSARSRPGLQVVDLSTFDPAEFAGDARRQHHAAGRRNVARALPRRRTGMAGSERDDSRRRHSRAGPADLYFHAGSSGIPLLPLSPWPGMTASLRIFPLVACLAAGAVPASAQNDQGVLIISRAGQEIGRESFRRVVNKADPSVVDSFTSIARFPATKPGLELSAVWGRSGPDAFTLLLDRRGKTEATSQILVAGGRNRITVRVVGRGGESAQRVSRRAWGCHTGRQPFRTVSPDRGTGR